jgi:hypothetical protein
MPRQRDQAGQRGDLQRPRRVVDERGRVQRAE